MDWELVKALFRLWFKTHTLSLFERADWIPAGEYAEYRRLSNDVIHRYRARYEEKKAEVARLQSALDALASKK